MMRRWKKLAATIWTTLLFAPLVAIAFGYLTASCLPHDPCSDGGALPHRGIVFLLTALLTAGHVAFLAMIWTAADPEARDRY